MASASVGDGIPLLRVTVVLGCSGTGKSALVEKILAGGAGARTAVVVAQPLGDHVATDPDDPGRSLTRNGQMVVRPEEPVEALQGGNGYDSSEGAVPFRADLVEEFCRIAASGDYDRVVLECGALCDPLTLEASFGTPIPSSFLAEQVSDAQPAVARLGSPLRSLDQLAFIDGVVTVVDTAAFWSQWQSVATVQDDAMDGDLDDADSRTHVAVMANAIEAAGVIVLNKVGAAGVEITESVRSAIRVLNPAAAIHSFEAATVDALLTAPTSSSADPAAMRPTTDVDGAAAAVSAITISPETGNPIDAMVDATVGAVSAAPTSIFESMLASTLTAASDAAAPAPAAVVPAAPLSASTGIVNFKEMEHMVNSLQQLGPNSLFLVAVEAALFSWDPLIFVLNEGNRDDAMDVAEWMVEVVAELFNKGKKVERDQVEDYLCDIIEAEFNMYFEDISPETVHVSRQICQFYVDCATGGTDPMYAFIYKVGKARGRFDNHFPAPLLARPMATPEPEEEEEEEVDPDGWETVKPKKKGGRK